MLKMNIKSICHFLAFAYGFSSAAQAFTLGAENFEFLPLNANVFVMHGPLTQPNKANHGFMNNPAFIETKNGIIVIDPGSTLEIGNAVLQEIRKHSSKPILAAFNTHIHGDHWLANQSLKLSNPSIKIYADQKTINKAKDSEGLVWLDLMDRLTEGLSKGTEIQPPTISVSHNEILSIDGEHFRIHSFPVTHTDTDIMIEHIESRTLFLGDNCVVNRMSRFDNSSSILGNIKALEYVADLNIQFFVPGHGPSGSQEAALQPFLSYLAKLKTLVEAGMEDDLEDYEIKEKLLNQFPEVQNWIGFEEQFGVNINKMYLELESMDL
jgi:glyoxylase-like metal-dependent hydrolase (beta-lactamase superfamily II)